jgi:hypothetical protein
MDLKGRSFLCSFRFPEIKSHNYPTQLESQYFQEQNPVFFAVFFPTGTIATRFTVVERIAQIEGITDSNYKNALIELEEDDSAGDKPSSWRSF